MLKVPERNSWWSESKSACEVQLESNFEKRQSLYEELLSFYWWCISEFDFLSSWWPKGACSFDWDGKDGQIPIKAISEILPLYIYLKKDYSKNIIFGK